MKFQEMRSSEEISRSKEDIRGTRRMFHRLCRWDQCCGILCFEFLGSSEWQRTGSPQGRFRATFCVSNHPHFSFQMAWNDGSPQPHSLSCPSSGPVASPFVFYGASDLHLRAKSLKCDTYILPGATHALLLHPRRLPSSPKCNVYSLTGNQLG